VIDPTNFTNFNRTYFELEEMWLFSCAVAGKTAKTQARLLDAMLEKMPGRTPFAKIHNAVTTGTLLQFLKDSGLGQYNRLERCYRESLSLDLANDPVEKFEAIFGVGPKTARMFLMHSRPDQQFAALDTHILKHMRAKGIDAPKSTPPSGPTYRRLEGEFLKMAKRARKSPADFDLMLWRRYAEAA